MTNEDQKHWWNRLFSKDGVERSEVLTARDTIELDLREHTNSDEKTEAPTPISLERETVADGLVESPLEFTPSNPSLQLMKDMEILQQEFQLMEERFGILLVEKAELQTSLQAKHSTERQLRASVQEKEQQVMASQHQQDSLQRANHQLQKELEHKTQLLLEAEQEQQKLQQKIVLLERAQTAQLDDEGRIKELEQLLEDITSQLCEEKVERKKNQMLEQSLEMHQQRALRMVLLLWHVAVRSLQRGCGRGAESAMWQSWQELYPFFREQLSHGREEEEDMAWLSWLLNEFQLCESLEWSEEGEQIAVKVTGIPDSLLFHDDSPELHSLHTPLPLLLTALLGFKDQQKVYVKDVSYSGSGESSILLQRYG